MSLTTLYIKTFPQRVYDTSTNRMANFIRFITTDYITPHFIDYLFEYDSVTNTSATPYPLFATDDEAITYYSSAAATALLTATNLDATVTYYTTTDIEKIDAPVAASIALLVPKTTTINGHTLGSNVTVGYGDLTGQPSFAAVATSGLYSDLTGKPSLASVATSGTYADLSGKPTINTPSFSNPSRSLNTAFQISSTQNAVVSYSVDIACTISLTSGQSGTAYLRYADDSGMTTNVKEVCRTANANTGSLTIGLNLTQTATGTLSGMIPAGKYAKIVTSNDTGTPTFTMRNSQEVTI